MDRPTVVSRNTVRTCSIAPIGYDDETSTSYLAVTGAGTAWNDNIGPESAGESRASRSAGGDIRLPGLIRQRARPLRRWTPPIAGCGRTTSMRHESSAVRASWPTWASKHRTLPASWSPAPMAACGCSPAICRWPIRFGTHCRSRRTARLGQFLPRTATHGTGQSAMGTIGAGSWPSLSGSSSRRSCCTARNGAERDAKRRPSHTISPRPEFSRFSCGNWATRCATLDDAAVAAGGTGVSPVLDAGALARCQWHPVAVGEARAPLPCFVQNSSSVDQLATHDRRRTCGRSCDGTRSCGRSASGRRRRCRTCATRVDPYFGRAFSGIRQPRRGGR